MLKNTEDIFHSQDTLMTGSHMAEFCVGSSKSH